MIAYIGGKEYQVNYTVNSLCALEDRAGMPIDRLMDRQFSAARLLLWAGLSGSLPDMTVAQAGDIIQEHIAQGGTLEDIVDICAEGLSEGGLLLSRGRATAAASD